MSSMVDAQSAFGQLFNNGASQRYLLKLARIALAIDFEFVGALAAVVISVTDPKRVDALVVAAFEHVRAAFNALCNTSKCPLEHSI